MPHRRRTPIEDEALCFEAGTHRLRLEQHPEGWAVSVDGLTLGARFPSQHDAWREGVRTAQALEAPAPDRAESNLHRPAGTPIQRPDAGLADAVDG